MSESFSQVAVCVVTWHPMENLSLRHAGPGYIREIDRKNKGKLSSDGTNNIIPVAESPNHGKTLVSRQTVIAVVSRLFVLIVFTATASNRIKPPGVGEGTSHLRQKRSKHSSLRTLSRLAKLF